MGNIIQMTPARRALFNRRRPLEVRIERLSAIRGNEEKVRFEDSGMGPCYGCEISIRGPTAIVTFENRGDPRFGGKTSSTTVYFHPDCYHSLKNNKTRLSQ